MYMTMEVTALWISKWLCHDLMLLCGNTVAGRGRSKDALLVLLVVGTNVDAALSLGASSSLLEQ